MRQNRVFVVVQYHDVILMLCAAPIREIPIFKKVTVWDKKIVFHPDASSMPLLAHEAIAANGLD
jgi:hypothetical protein